MPKPTTTTLIHASPRKPTQCPPVPQGYPFPVSCSPAALDTNNRKNRKQKRTRKRSLKRGSNQTAVLLGYRGDRTDRVRFLSTNAHLEAWKWINAVCPGAKNLSILGYSQNPSLNFCYRITSSTSSCVCDVVLVATTVYCGCQPIHYETISSTGRISLKNATEYGESTDEHSDSNPTSS